jgi:hypothetical protein
MIRISWSLFGSLTIKGDQNEKEEIFAGLKDESLTKGDRVIILRDGYHIRKNPTRKPEAFKGEPQPDPTPEGSVSDHRATGWPDEG